MVFFATYTVVVCDLRHEKFLTAKNAKAEQEVTEVVEK